MTEGFRMHGSCRLRLVVYLAIAILPSATSSLAADNGGASGGYQAPSPEPTPWETLILEYINRCRANPAADAELCITSKRVPGSVDVDMFRREMYAEQPAPPMVFDLSLLKAARAHSYYQIVNDQTHTETEGKPGFTGVTPSDRVRAAGFAGGSAENIFRDAQDPWYSHAGFVVDWGEGSGGMQPGRGHRRNILNPSYRVAGCGAVAHQGTKTFAVTHNFATTNKRMAGGVIIKDGNRNGVYDLGEGVEGVTISVGGEKLKSWSSGAYAIEIPTGKTKVTIDVGDQAFSTYLPEGTENVKFDVNLLTLAQSTRITALLKSIEAIPSDTEANQTRRFNSLVDLYFQSQGMLIEDAVIEEVNRLTTPVRDELEKTKSDTLASVQSGAVEDAERLVLDAQTKYSRTLIRPWFGDAKNCLDMRKVLEQMAGIASSGNRIAPATLDRVIRRQTKTFSLIHSPEWKKVAFEIGKKTAALQK